MAKVIVAMSGGVDSSVAASLLTEKGYEVIGVTMSVWEGEALPENGTRHGCYGPDEVEDARKVAQALGIPFYTFDLRQEYRTEVLDYFSHEYLLGRTPNPCIRCNRWVKFGALLRKARDRGLQFDYFATGHYARVEHVEGKGRYLLKKAKDEAKDQSYFLFALSQEQLSGSLFPLGNYTKGAVRKMAEALGLGVDLKPESQDFFTRDYAPLLGEAPGPGPILNKEGEILGEHRGVPFYTIGQRKGLGISAEEPLYVIRIDPERNALVVGSKEDVYGGELVASELNWIALEKLERPIEARARIRYLHNEAEVMVTPLHEDKVRVKFKEPQMAITPGQAVVFYDNDTVLGGGTIERTGS